jgi:phenylalanyl-tRNA synthetase beta chain
MHRSDMAREVDLIEEVVRVWGIERVPPSLPATRGARAGVTRDWRVRRRLRETLCALGLDEAIHMVFTSSRELSAAGFDVDKAIRLANPLSDERSHLRPSLVPKLVSAAGLARRRGEARVRLYEVGSTFEASQEALPREETRVAMVMSGARDTWLSRPEELDFYDLKGLLEELIERVTHVAPTFDREGEAPAWAHPRAWARVCVDDLVVGVIAMAHPDVIERADLGRATALAELDLACIATPLRTPAARAPSRYPASRRDVALLVEQRVSAGDVLARLRALAGSLCESVTLFDRYEGKELPAGTHSLAFSLTFRAEDRTLLDNEVDALVDAVTRGARESFGAAQR